MLTKTQRVQTSDRNSDQLQFNILKNLETLSTNPLLNGIVLPVKKNGVVLPFLLRGASVTALSLLSANNPTEITHNLGRDLTGWLVIGNTASCTVWDSQSLNTTPYLGIDKTLLLNVSANTTLTLYVF